MLNKFRTFTLACLIYPAVILLIANGSWSLADESVASFSQNFAQQVANLARNQPDQALAIADQAIDYFNQNPLDVLSQAIVLNESAYAFYISGDYVKAMTRAKWAEQFSQENQIDQQTARSYMVQGNILQGISEFESALKHYQKALIFYRDKKVVDIKNHEGVLNNIANAYFRVGQYENARSFYQESLDIAKTICGKASAHLGFANIFSGQDHINQAIDHFQLAYQLFGQCHDQLGQELAQNGIALIYIDQGELTKALQQIESSIHSATQGQRKFRLSVMVELKARALEELGQLPQALEQLDLAMSFAEEINDLAQKMNLYYQKALLLEKIQDFKGAYQALNQAQDLEIQIDSIKEKQRLSVMRAEFELDKKNHEINLLSAENKYQLLQIEQNRIRQFNLIILVVFGMGLVLFVFYRRYHSKLLRNEQEVNQRLREIDLVKDRVLVNTSHEFRTPLNGIVGLSSIILDDPLLSDETRENIKLIAECGSRLHHLVEDILTLSQVKEHQLKVKLKPVEVFNLVQRLVNFLKVNAAKKGIAIEFEIEPANVQVLADENRLYQILFNLIDNAIKYSDQGVVKVKVSLQQQEVLFSVSDQGIGIPQDQISQIFKPFEQVESHQARKEEGAGLGLPIVRELIRLHNSDINVSSALGEGSCFWFTLKLAEPILT